MYELLESNLVQAAFGAILVGYVLKFLVKGYQVRRQRRSLVSSLLSFFSFSIFGGFCLSLRWCIPNQKLTRFNFFFLIFFFS